MMTRFLKQIAVLVAGLALVGTAQAATLIDNSTTGLYNSGIGRSLNGTNPYGSSYLFPLGETRQSIDYTAADEPDLSKASKALGNWLTNPAASGGAWSSAPVSIPTTWAKHSETAIIYAIDAGTKGLTNVIGSFGVDNGMFVWLNGKFLGGFMRPGGAFDGEWTLSLGNLAAGMNYLQILREDHGYTTGYTVSVTDNPPAPAPVPLPASALLLLAGIGGLATVRRRKSV